jgi:hypothetical protein
MFTKLYYQSFLLCTQICSKCASSNGGVPLHLILYNGALSSRHVVVTDGDCNESLHNYVHVITTQLTSSMESPISM